MGDREHPVKLFYRIGEVAQMVDLDTSVLRHWEREFRALRPRRTRSGQRLYSQVDVQRVREIKRLLHEQGFTTRGAQQRLREKGIEPRRQGDPLVAENDRLRAALAELHEDIQELLHVLDEEPTE